MKSTWVRKLIFRNFTWRDEKNPNSWKTKEISRSQCNTTKSQNTVGCLEDEVWIKTRRISLLQIPKVG